MTASLADRFEAVVDAHPDLAAVDTEAGEVTYAELDARANQVAAWLTSLGLGPGDRVALALWNRVEHLEVLLGAFKARAIPVNVNCRYSSTETAALLADSGAQVIVHEKASTLVVSEAIHNGEILTVSVGDVYESAIGEFPRTRRDIGRSGDDHYILYTGGSTGTPKGVVWRQGDVYAAAMAAAEERRPGSRMLPASPLTHGTAQWTTLSTLLSAGTVVFGPPRGLDPTALWSRVADAHVSRLVIVGDAFARPLLDALDSEPDRWDLSALVAITSGGARWSSATRHGLLRHLPHVAMVNSFGATEAGGQGSQVTFAGEPEGPGNGLLRFEPDDTAVVLDAQNHPIEPGSGIVGMLARRGPVPLEYLNDPERTSQVFPVIDGVRHAIPGDMATVEADGSIVVLGRGRNVINTGGEKVYAEEVEAHLMGHPTVAEAVVVGVPDERWGETIGALVVPRGGAEPDTTELTEYCRSDLASFKIPRHFGIVDTIAHLPTGKLDRRWAAATMAPFVSDQRTDR